MRSPIVAGNWKMFTTAGSAEQLASDIVRGLDKTSGTTVAVCPPFPYLLRVAEVLRGSPVGLREARDGEVVEVAQPVDVRPFPIPQMGRAAIQDRIGGGTARKRTCGVRLPPLGDSSDENRHLVRRRPAAASPTDRDRFCGRHRPERRPAFRRGASRSRWDLPGCGRRVRATM